MSKKFRSGKKLFRYGAISLAAFAAACTLSLTACNDSSDSTDKKEEETSAVTKVDKQILKNGNFEFFDDNDGVYLISNPNNWTSGTSGTSSNAMSGIIGTDKASWDKFEDVELPETLKKNDDLDSDDENKVDYNGMLEDDIPYSNTHDATEENATADKKVLISNPNTHLYKYEGESVLDAEDNAVTIYEDEDGKKFVDEEKTIPYETNVLMIHNYTSNTFDGTERYYTSASVTLEANTAASLSVWVKTSDLYWEGTTGDRTEVKDSRGAYIKVDQKIGSTSVDSFEIKNINTQSLNPDGANNGWVEYTVYIQACDYADTTITVVLGLGENKDYTCEGYAFFDDLEIKKYYHGLDELKKEVGAEEFESSVSKTTCDLLSEAEDKIYRTDKQSFSTVEGETEVKPTNEHFFKYRKYFIDLSTESDKAHIQFGASSVKASLTVDGDNYACTRENKAKVENLSVLNDATALNLAYLPHDVKTFDTTDDVLAAFDITDGWTSNLNAKYDKKITDALKSATKIPATNGTANTLFMLSAEGAAYEALIEDSTNFTVEAEKYKVISFWLKTSDMGGKTAATFTVSDTADTDNNASFSLDSTTVEAVKYEDEELYDGWVQCFLRVYNPVKITESDNGTRTFNIKVNFGNTAIKEAENTSYKNGWLAIADMRVLNADETAYGIAGDVGHVASLTFDEKETVTNRNFDDEFAGGESIKTGIARPGSYNGANGNTPHVNDVPATDSDFNAFDNNDFAGLINRDYIKNYYDNRCAWLSKITAVQTLTDPDAIWSELAGKYSVQPLLIVNTARKFADKAEQIYNYGYISKSTQTAPSDGYKAVSKKVKVSAGAIATVYLTDPDDKSVAGLTLPEITFWYDDDGNVLKGKPEKDADDEAQRANIAYTSRLDGLYEKDGKVYANFYAFTPEYFDQKITYYDENGNSVTHEYLKDGVMYYKDANKTAYAPHYLVNSTGKRIFRYTEGLIGTDADNRVYAYVDDDAVDYSYKVRNFDTEVATPRYQYSKGEKSEYSITIDTIAHPELADKWITVSFYFRAGNQNKDFKVELWSGTRDTETCAGVQEGSYVMFDYATEDLDESGFTDMLKYYEDKIIRSYKDNLGDVAFDSDSETIAYFEGLAAEKDTIYDYEAKYYAYTLYDSEGYYPFNGLTAKDNETGYDYTQSTNTESLAYLKVTDCDRPDPSISVFADYSLLEKTVSIGTISDADDDNTDDNDTTATTTDDGTSVWLLISSILIVVAIIVAIIGVLVKDFVKKHKKSKVGARNSYNYNKNKRYVKKYVKSNGEAPVSEETTEAEPATEEATEETTESVEATEETEAEPEQTDVETAEENSDKPEGNE